MKSTKYAILISFVLSALTCSAMKYQIKVLNTPTISIDSKEAKVGDWFDDNSKIAWSKENQAMRVLSEDNHVYTLSAKLYKEASAKKFSDFIAYTKPLAVRGATSTDIIDQLRERFEQDFVMLDELVIDLSEIDFNSEDCLEFRRHDNYNCGDIVITKSPISQMLKILRSEVMNEEDEEECVLSFIITFYPTNDKSAIVTDTFDVEAMRISQE